MLQQAKKQTVKEVLLRQPSFLLELCRFWDDEGHERHSFVMRHAVAGRPSAIDNGGSVLLAGEGHDVSRRDIHKAFYLFQRFHLSDAPARQQANA